jgi:hypothetical protein
MRRTILIILSALFIPVGSAAASEYVKLQPDPATGEDAYTISSDPDGNHGDESNLTVASPANFACCIFIEFSALDNYIGDNCDDAFLWFHVETASTQDDTGLRLGAVNSDWQEMTITWNTMPGIHDSESIPYPTQSHTWWGINVQSIVADWLNGTYDNDGFCLFDSAGPATERALVYSSDITFDPSLRPYLELYYTPDSSVEEVSWGSIKAEGER